MHHCKETLFVLCFLFGASLALAQGQPAGEAHLANAGLHAKGKPSLMAAMARWCSPETAPSTSLQDRSLRLQAVEMAYPGAASRTARQDPDAVTCGRTRVCRLSGSPRVRRAGAAHLAVEPITGAATHDGGARLVASAGGERWSQCT